MVDLRPQIPKKHHLVNGFLLQNSSRNRFQDGIRASTLRYFWEGFKLGFVCSVGDFFWIGFDPMVQWVFFHHHLEKMFNVIFAKHRRFANHNWLLWSSRWWLKDDTHPVSITFFATLGGWDPRTKFLRIGLVFPLPNGLSLPPWLQRRIPALTTETSHSWDDPASEV